MSKGLCAGKILAPNLTSHSIMALLSWTSLILFGCYRIRFYMLIFTANGLLDGRLINYITSYHMFLYVTTCYCTCYCQITAFFYRFSHVAALFINIYILVTFDVLFQGSLHTTSQSYTKRQCVKVQIYCFMTLLLPVAIFFLNVILSD